MEDGTVAGANEEKKAWTNRLVNWFCFAILLYLIIILHAMKKHLLIFCSIFLLSTVIGFAQKVTLKLVNASSLQAIEGASLKSFLDAGFHGTSDKYGHITVQLKENDTLTISKNYYHPLYLYIKAKNFDSTHVISINMVPSKDIHEPVKGDFHTLSDFDYHFVHDKIGDDSHLKVIGYEHQDASQTRTDLMHSTKKPDGFHITPVRHHQYAGGTQYKLKEEE